MPVFSFGVSDTGCVRSENQDRLHFDDASGCYVICDGVGGRRRGGAAAEIAVQALRQYIESSSDPGEVTWPYGYDTRVSFPLNRLFTAVRLANRRVWRQAEDSLEFLGMGATVAAALAEGATMAIANVGDSRVYRYRTGNLEQLTTDDTAITAVPTPSGTEMRRVLTSAAGSRESVEVHLREVEMCDGDLFLLCSDGLYHAIPEADIQAVMAVEGPPATQVQTLIAAGRSAGGPDNLSAVVVRYGATAG